MSQPRPLFNLLLRAMPCPGAREHSSYVFTDMPPWSYEDGDTAPVACPTCGRFMFVQLRKEYGILHTSSATLVSRGFIEWARMTEEEVEAERRKEPQYFVYSLPHHLFVPPRFNRPEMRRRVASFKHHVWRGLYQLRRNGDWEDRCDW